MCDYLLTCGGDDVSPDGGALEEEKEDAEEAHDDLVVVQSRQMGVAVADLKYKTQEF